MRDQKSVMPCYLAPKRRARRRTRRSPLAGPGAEVGPQRVGEDELGVRSLPEHEVRDPPLPGGADQQVDVTKLGGVEPLRERVLVDGVRRDAVDDQPARRLHELGAAAVVEGDPQVEGVEIRGLAAPERPSSRAARREHGRGGRRTGCGRPAWRGRAAHGRSSPRGSPSASPPRPQGGPSSRSRTRRPRATGSPGRSTPPRFAAAPAFPRGGRRRRARLAPRPSARCRP